MTLNATPPSTTADANNLARVKPRKHPTYWLASALVALVGAMLIHLLVTSPNLQWDVVAEYFTAQTVLEGLARTLQLTVIAMVVGIVLGVVLAVMRLSPVPLLSWTSWLFIWFFRGTPLLVQIIFWYNLAALLPELSIGIPFGGPDLITWDTNSVITPFVASVLALSLNEGAYMAEIVRGGILSVDHGQGEAAGALGFRKSQIMRRIVLPQAMRVIVPPTGNQTISMLKATALVSVTSMPELLYSVQLIYSRTFQTIPLLIVASLWYLLVCTILSIGQYYIERHYARGAARSLPPTPLTRLRNRFAASRAATTPTERTPR